MTMKSKSPGSEQVAIIGAGFSGLASAISLIKRGISDFTIFEAAEGIGGTWWHNRYPGAEVDLESHIYSFSFEPYDWSRTHATWDEILDYLNHVAAKWNLTPRIRLNERVESVRWVEDKDSYELTTSKGVQPNLFTSVISCVGFLNLPLIPPFARSTAPFSGSVCHTSRWEKDLTTEGKRVGVLGTGSSGVQIVSEAAKDAEHVTVFQIEPNWILPKNARDFTPAERESFRDPATYYEERNRLYRYYDDMQDDASHARQDGDSNAERARTAKEYLEDELADRPDLLELVTPSFIFESRRTVNSDDYYQAIQSQNVTIIPKAATSFYEDGLIDADGKKHPLDVVVLATGFDAANYLGKLTVVGRNDRTIHEFWNGEASAFLGVMVPGFPNFFMLYGPNTNSIPLITFYEAQADFVAHVIDEKRRRSATTAEVSESEYESFNDWVQGELDRTVWGEVRNYFQAESGRIVSQWPHSPSKYIELIEAAKKQAIEYDH